jgi:4a-hydroxytetrahydrobiopterin dehydratase
MAIAPLNVQQRQDALAQLPGWIYDADRKAFFREILLEDFVAAFALMTRIALEAEKADHHPEWSNVYNRVSIWLTTHDAGDVSARDVSLARLIDRFAPAGP